MSDEFAKKVEGEPPIQPGSPDSGKSVTLMITLHPNGHIDFQLPMGNKILAYGLLECARAQLDKMYLSAEVKASGSPRGGMNGLLKRMNGG